MRYRVELGGKQLDLELSEAGPGRYTARVGSPPEQRELAVTVLSERPTLAVLIDGQVVELAPLGAGTATARGTRAPARVLDPLEARSGPNARAQAGGAAALSSPMPGRIVKLMVALGDAVTAGQPALVIEAMKMENELVCQRAGVVKRILVKPGDAVERSALLIEIG